MLVVDNLFIGCEFKCFGFLCCKEMEKCVIELMVFYGFFFDVCELFNCFLVVM